MRPKLCCDKKSLVVTAFTFDAEVRYGSKIGYPGSGFCGELEHMVASVRDARNTELGTPTKVTRLGL